MSTEFARTQPEGELPPAQSPDGENDFRDYKLKGPADADWMLAAKCREIPPDTFFPSGATGVEVARRICADCVVKTPCLEFALANRIEHGVWGGASERDRRRIARRRRLD